MPGHSRKAENRAKYEAKCRELGGRRPASGIPSGGPASGIPAHPGDRPPVGWDRLEHGATSPTVVSQVAERLRDELLEVRPDLGSAEYRPALAAWSVAEARCQLLRNYSDQKGLLGDDGDPLPYVKLSESVEARAAKERARLGLDPRSSAALARERAEATGSVVSLAALADAGRQALDSRTGTAINSAITTPMELEDHQHHADDDGGGDGQLDDHQHHLDGLDHHHHHDEEVNR